MDTKFCARCSNHRPLSDFCKSRQTFDGLYPTCTPCRKRIYRSRMKTDAAFRNNRRAKAREWAKNNPEAVKANSDIQNAKPKHIALRKKVSARWEKSDAGKKWRSQWKASNKEKHRAHRAVCYAVKSGKLVRPNSCEKCGVDSADLDGHHHKGYDEKHILDVVWLCGKCHHAADRAKRRSSKVPPDTAAPN